ncbi:MAG: 1,4-dihydroxy-6-naphthoate synthase [Alistipes sp.]|nr:1,4-dihydroxy-6-naphthoate synthase [Alistipes sp.]
MKKVVRLAISPCPNDTFMFDAIVNKRIDLGDFEIEVTYLDIEQLNGAALERKYDITKCSTALLPAIYDRYALLDSGSALGRGNGPLLVRRQRETTPLKHIAVPGEHTTANALVRALFPEIAHRTPCLFSEIAARVERGEFDGGVLIHEGRFVYQRSNLELVADLGIEWERSTGLPLPLGSIVVARDLGDELRLEFDELLRKSIAYAFANPKQSRDYIRQHAQELEDSVIDSHISLFVNDFSLSLGDEGCCAVERLTGLKLRAENYS